MTETSTAAELVQLEALDGVLIITIDRAAQKNAINRDVATQLAAAIDRLDADDALSVGILTGAGGIFSAGMDLKAFARGETPILPDRGFGGLTRTHVSKPLIAAVEGWALGGGFEMALACDLIVAAEDARFGFPEVTRGIIAGEGGIVRLPRRIPYQVALRALLTGDPLTAREGHEFGLVADLAEPGGALMRAHELATQIARNAPLALAAVKRVAQATQNEDEAFALQDEIAVGLLTTNDAKEGATAFAEKRAPVWTGS